MQIYLPIAEMPVNIINLLALGLSGGVLSGMFGIGGGVIVTPFLIFLGIPHTVAVATTTNQILGASFSGVFAHFREGNVDTKMGSLLIIGGVLGSILGIQLFAILKATGYIEIVISLTYVILLTIIGTLMVIESIIKYYSDGVTTKDKRFNINLPFILYFRVSNVKVSLILPIMIGIMGGMLVSLLGIGGGFIMIPAMIYLLGIPTIVAIGTSLLQIVFVTAVVTMLQAVLNHAVDIILAFILMLSSVVGAQLGIKLGKKFSAEKLKILLALIILFIAFKLAFSLLLEPSNLYEVFIQ